MSRFAYCLDKVLDLEGGLSNNLSDRGGKTNRGVTQATYSDWLRHVGLPYRDVAEIHDSEVEAIYFDLYWKPAKCDSLPAPLDLAVFDCAINSGHGRAVRLLQNVLGIGADGIFGNMTLKAVHEDVRALGVESLFERYMAERENWYERIVENDATQGVFLKGWLNRLAKIEAVADVA